MEDLLEVRDRDRTWNLILEPEQDERANVEIYDKSEGEFSNEYKQLLGYLNSEIQDPELCDEYAIDRIQKLGKKVIADRLEQEGYLERRDGRWEASKPEGEEIFDPKEAHDVDTEEGDTLHDRYQRFFDGHNTKLNQEENANDDRMADEEVDPGMEEDDSDKNSGFTYG